MAERLTYLKAKAFRGVPDELILDLPDARSLVVLGPNGSGKSSIADALEFFLTGDVSTLAREGRRVIHHVARDRNETEVAVRTTGHLGGTATLAGGPSKVRDAAARETFLLRGSTLAAFVDKTKHEKWAYLLDLLGIGDLENLREDLQYAANELANRATGIALEFSRREEEVRRAFPDAADAEVLRTLQVSAERSGLPVPRELPEILTDEWMANAGGRQDHVKKAGRLEQLQRDARRLSPFPGIGLLKAWNGALGSKDANKNAFGKMVVAATVVFEGSPADTCPLCGQSVIPDDFGARLREMVDEIKLDEASLRGPRDAARRYLSLFRAAVEQRQNLVARATREGVVLEPVPSSPHDQGFESVSRELPVPEDSFQVAAAAFATWDKKAVEALGQLSTHVDPKDKELLRFFSLLQVSRSWVEARRRNREAIAVAERARAIFDAYQSAQHRYVNAILEQVSDRVATLFGKLHHQEGLGAVSVETMGEKGVELAATFHSVSYCPPHGILSESRLNALGLSLFLAMAETFNESIGFMCLDDVVNSFDADHRGSLAAVLVEEFPKWQLIVLTHDQLFFQRLHQLAPSWATREFTSCSYAGGPRTTGYNTPDLIGRSSEHMDRGEWMAAAVIGRRALEELLQEICEGLTSLLPFRRGVRNDQRESGELLRGVRRSLKDLKMASPRAKDLLASLETDLQTVFNVTAHASVVSASESEIREAVARIVAFDSLWTCERCASRGWHRGGPGAFRCKCGELSWPESARGGSGNQPPVL